MSRLGGRPGAIATSVASASRRTTSTTRWPGAADDHVRRGRDAAGRRAAGRVLRLGPGHERRSRSAIHQVGESGSDGLVLVHAIPQVREDQPQESIHGRPSRSPARPTSIQAEPPKDLLHFHARWRYQDDLQTKKADGTLDWPALRVSGAPGRFVGLLLNVYNPTPAWWGEGDEKIYVDGESFPSTFGTGTEDYFGYAWGDNHLYTNPFHAQTRCDGPGSKGNTSNIRYQLLDSVPFQKSLGFDIEVWHWEPVKIQYATVAYFYAGPGAKVEPGVPDLSGRKVHPRPPIKREPGALEAEDLKVKAKTAGDVPESGHDPLRRCLVGGPAALVGRRRAEREARPRAARQGRGHLRPLGRLHQGRRLRHRPARPRRRCRSANPSTSTSPLPG